MTEATLTAGKLEKVYFFVGTFSDIRTHRKFVKAPFNRLHLDGSQYIIPQDAYASGGIAFCAGTIEYEEGPEMHLLQGMFYDTKEDIVMEPHEMGDWNGNKDNWTMMHQFGWV
jgi:hypothetical protein